MKLTKSKLKEIISEELEEMLTPPGTPRMSTLGPSGLSPGEPSPEMETEPGGPYMIFQDLMSLNTRAREMGVSEEVLGHLSVAARILADELELGQ